MHIAEDACANLTDPWLNEEIAVWLLRTIRLETSQREMSEPCRLQLTGTIAEQPPTAALVVFVMAVPSPCPAGCHRQLASIPGARRAGNCHP